MESQTVLVLRDVLRDDAARLCQGVGNLRALAPRATGRGHLLPPRKSVAEIAEQVAENEVDSVIHRRANSCPRIARLVWAFADERRTP